MKFHPETHSSEFPPHCGELLNELRERRGFNPETYVDAKVTLINDYMRNAGLKTCVVAVSGGIDSAAVLGLVAEAAKRENSPIEAIWPICLPISKPEYTTHQDEALARAVEVSEKFGLKAIPIDLTDAFMATKRLVDAGVGVEGEPWASGQLISYSRTPALYYATSLASQLEKPAIICGTTNRDEGSYLGYVGKASDGMVDLQIISDLHKSEVRAIARHLGVPESILNARPTGDMYDGREDEEVFGTTYDFAELFLLLKSLPSEVDRAAALARLSPEDLRQYEEAARALEALHDYNAHKYKVGSPAVHLDVMESGVPGGWTHSTEKVNRRPDGKEYFVNAFDLNTEFLTSSYEEAIKPTEHHLEVPKGEALSVESLLTQNECHELLRQADQHGWIPVGLDGIASHFHDGEQIGSWRASTFSPELADMLWSRLSRLLPATRVFNNDPQIDVDPNSVWRPIGISPLMRYIKYTEGGLLVPHYDAPFEYPDGQKTLMSLVIYLDANGITGGTTRFLHDPKLDIPVAQRDLSDWGRYSKEDDVLLAVNPEAGSALTFDHRLLHDAEQIDGVGQKVIIRTDVVFVACKK